MTHQLSSLSFSLSLPFQFQFPFKKRKKQAGGQLEIVPLSNEQVQLDWIKGLQDQVDFANNPEVLPDYILYLMVAKRRLDP